VREPCQMALRQSHVIYTYHHIINRAFLEDKLEHFAYCKSVSQEASSKHGLMSELDLQSDFWLIGFSEEDIGCEVVCLTIGMKEVYANSTVTLSEMMLHHHLKPASRPKTLHWQLDISQLSDSTSVPAQPHLFTGGLNDTRFAPKLSLLALDALTSSVAFSCLSACCKRFCSAIRAFSAWCWAWYWRF